MMDNLETFLPFRHLLPVIVLVIFLGWETGCPFIVQYARDRTGLKRRGLHVGWNLSVGIVNSALTTLFFVGLWGWATYWAEERQFGLLYGLSWSPVVRAVLAFLLLDLWTYAWHRLNHRVPLFWRFHRYHHSDQNMDVSTASRFHFMEIALSSLLRVPVLLLLGASLGELAVYEVFLFGVVQFQHANIGLPERLDRLLRWVIVTPTLHKVHHSVRRIEADSNYGSLLTWWDRLFGSWKLLPADRRIEFGVED